jgi:glycosyltransferase involved in cell wall biosynthesis
LAYDKTGTFVRKNKGIYKMRIAIVHDYIKEYGGAERVLEGLHEIFPDASIYTSVYLPEFLGPHKERFAKMDIKASFLQKFPLKSKLISPFRLLASRAFKKFDFSEFDVVIVSATGAYLPNSINKKRAIQICYCHTPPRYLYGFATAREWKKNPFLRVLGEAANHFLRTKDYKFSQNVDYFIANSQNVKGRIRKFYQRDAVVIYPPVSSATNEQATSNQLKNKRLMANKLDTSGYFLAGGRLARPKHIDLIVKTFTKNGLPLKIFGKAFAGYGEELKNIAGPNIEFLGEVEDSEKLKLMSKAKAFIFASEDEDFGITPVEAMGVGTPVIAYRSGGVLESVVEGKTGLFFDELTIGNLSKTIGEFTKTKFNSQDCISQAQKFSKERFKKEIKDFVSHQFAK